jgi:hypothetical protein
MTPLDIVGIVAAVGAMLGLCVYHLSVIRELSKACRETSRFPLFAARRHLIQLVADEEMSEEDDAWRAMYQNINNLLGLQNSLHRLDLFSKYLQFLVAMRQDPRVRAKFERAMRVEETAAKRVPAFATIRTEVTDALQHLVKRRSNSLHSLAIVTIIGFIQIIHIARSVGLGAAFTIALTALRGPSPLDLRGSTFGDRRAA